MKTAVRLAEVLEKKIGKEVGLHEIGYETMWFMHGEIDEDIVPPSVISNLAEPIICDSANFTDEEGNYYTFIVVETGNVDPYEVWLVNDKVIPNFIEEYLI